jgi:hypothetical protein
VGARLTEEGGIEIVPSTTNIEKIINKLRKILVSL